MKFVRFVLDQSLLMNLLTLLVLVLGTMLAINMRREAFPTISFDLVRIEATYPGASPQEVEQLVIDPLEDEIDTVNGIKEYGSVAIDGFGIITVTLDPNRSEEQKEETIADLQRAVDRVQDLPEDMPDRPIVEEVESTDLPVIEIGLSGLDYGGLAHHADRLIRRLEALPDVNRVDWRSEREREIWVEVDQDKLQRYGLSLGSLIAALRVRNINLPGGAVPVGDREVLVRTVGELLTPEEIGAVVIRANDAGVLVRVRDVATVTDTFEEAQRLYRTNGEDSINLSVIINASTGDIIRLVDKVMEVTQHYLETAGEPRLKVAYANDISYFVKNRLGVLVNNGAVGIVLVLAVLVLFLSKGIAFVTALGLPIAFLGTLMAMSYLGITINLISMFGLIIVLGMLVDDAIIVAENIWQHYEEGKPPRQATIDGTSEVFWPVLATILTTMAAFMPLLLITGIFGKFMRGMPMVVMIALSISLIEAMAVLPSHAYDMLKWRERWRGRGGGNIATAHKHSKLPGAELVMRAYEHLLRGVLRWRYVFMTAILGLLGVSLWFAKTHMNFVLFPSSNIDAFFVRVEMPAGTSLDDTAAAMVPIERMIATLPESELKSFVTYVGIIQNDVSDPFTKRGSNVGQVAVYLYPELERDRTSSQIIESLRSELDRIAAEQGYEHYSFTEVRQGPPVGKPVAIRIKGENLDELNALAQVVAAELETIPGLSDIDINFQRGKDEVQVRIDEEAAARALVSVQDVAAHVNAAFSGQVATLLRTGGEQVPLRVRFNEAGRDQLRTLDRIQITNRAGLLIPLSQVAHIERVPGITQITHRDGQRTISVTANLNDRVTSYF